MLSYLQTIRDQIIVLNLNDLVAGIFCSFFLSIILRWFYIKYGSTHANRHSLGNIFLLLTVSVTLIMFMIKESLALSLGLVGALSIVRFRAAIKEPEELVYLLFAIAIGLGFGSSHTPATFVAFAIILPALFIFNKVFVKPQMASDSVFITFKSVQNSSQFNGIKELQKLVDNHVKWYEVRRLDQGKNHFTAVFLVKFSEKSGVANLLEEVKTFNDSLDVTLVDNSKPLAIY